MLRTTYIFFLGMLFTFDSLCLINESKPIVNVNPNSRTEFEMSPYGLKRLVACESGLYQTIKEYRDNNSLKLVGWSTTKLASYLDDYESSSGLLSNGTSDEYTNAIVGHPFLVFRMLFRLVRDIAKLKLELSQHLMRAKVSCPVVTEEHLKDAMKGLMRVIRTYNLDLLQFVSGDIHGTLTNHGLELRHILAIGKFTLDSKLYDGLAVEWLELGKAILYKKLQESGLQSEDVASQLDKLIAMAIKTHDERFDSSNQDDGLLFANKILQSPDVPYKFVGYVRRTRQKTNPFVSRRTGGRKIYEWDLCTGKRIPNHTHQEQLLFCWYNTEAIPIYPFKMEQLATPTSLVLIHGFLKEADAKKIVAAAEPYTKNSMVYDNDNGQVHNPMRSSYSVFLQAQIAPLAKKMDKHMEFATGLRVRTSYGGERLQVASYTAFGGHYGFHLDEVYGGSADRLYGRIATFMIYLNDVESGGLTAFSQVGLSTTPVLGNAVFWYNVDPYGEVEFNARHAACPVILGTKYIVNKWISYNDQFDRKKCPAMAPA